MKTLGIDQVSKAAQNSSFLLNGTEHSSLSNTITVNNAFELTFNQPSKAGTIAQIGFKADTDAIADNIESLINVYNNIIELGKGNSTAQESNRLLNDMSGVAKAYHEELDAMGIHMQADGSLNIDHNELAASVSSDNAGSYLVTMNKFKDTLGEKASNASIDPMNYVNKLIVAYKNPSGHNFVTPYITSIYSGMMLDEQC